MPNVSPQDLRRRKLLLVLPVMVIPFFTLAFWALGGGSGTDAQGVQTPNKGLNVILPDANFKGDKEMNKLSFYDRVAADSAQLEEQIKNDPYFHLKTRTDLDSMVEPDHDRVDPHEKKVYEKLSQINAALAETTQTKPVEKKMPEASSGKAAGEEIQRLEQLMQGMQQPTSATPTDPQMNQLSGMLDKILDIQHPERLRDQLQERSREHRQVTYPVNMVANTVSVGLMDSTDTSKHEQHLFLGMEETLPMKDQNAIEAVVHEHQVLVNGAVVKLRLLQPVYINGHLIPKDNFLFGTTELNQERLEIKINTIREGTSLFPVQLEVYDLDGLPGIYIPGAITRDVTKQSTDNALQSVALNSLNPTIGAQAASAGIETAKNLLSKKIKLIKVQVKAGYKVLLKDTNEK